jgi:hypothetical protein
MIDPLAVYLNRVDTNLVKMMLHSILARGRVLYKGMIFVTRWVTSFLITSK